MIVCTLLAVAAMASPIEDFCPMDAGARWTYENESGLQLVVQYGAPIDVGKGVTAIPKTDSVNGRSSGSELYRITGDTLEMVGVIDRSKKEPVTDLFPAPVTILKAGEGKSKWSYDGEVSTGLGPVLKRVTGESSRGGKRKVLDREVETLIVHVTTKIGNTTAHQIEVRQDLVYGKGIGLVENSEVTRADGKSVKRMLKLVKFEPAQG